MFVKMKRKLIQLHSTKFEKTLTEKLIFEGLTVIRDTNY